MGRWKEKEREGEKSELKIRVNRCPISESCIYLARPVLIRPLCELATRWNLLNDDEMTAKRNFHFNVFKIDERK